MGCRVGPDLFTDTIAQIVIEHAVRGESHEEYDPQIRATLVGELLSDHQALDDLGKLLDLPIDLRRADSHAAGIERGVAAAVDDESAPGRQLSPVAVPPDAAIYLEVRRPVLASIRIIPERHRHARNVCRAY